MTESRFQPSTRRVASLSSSKRQQAEQQVGRQDRIDVLHALGEIVGAQHVVDRRRDQSREDREIDGAPAQRLGAVLGACSGCHRMISAIAIITCSGRASIGIGG